MKKVIFAVLVCLCSIVVLTGCADTPKEEEHQSDTERFSVVVYERPNTILVDTETGVMYFFHKDGYGGGMSVMLDTEGRPLIWDGE